MVGTVLPHRERAQFFEPGFSVKNGPYPFHLPIY
jgi:hypothetical protein